MSTCAFYALACCALARLPVCTPTGLYFSVYRPSHMRSCAMHLLTYAPPLCTCSHALLRCAPALCTCSHVLLRYAPAHMCSYAMHLLTCAPALCTRSHALLRYAPAHMRSYAMHLLTYAPKLCTFPHALLHHAPSHHQQAPSAAGSTGEGRRRHGCAVVIAPWPALWDYKTSSTLSADCAFSGNAVERGGRRARGSTS